MKKFGVALTLAASLLLARGALAGDGCQAPCGPAACGAACNSKACGSACKKHCACGQKDCKPACKSACKPACKSECGKEGVAKRVCHSLCENLCHLRAGHKECAPCQTCGCHTQAAKPVAPAPGPMPSPPTGYPGPTVPPPAKSPAAAVTAPPDQSVMNTEPMPAQ